MEICTYDISAMLFCKLNIIFKMLIEERIEYFKKIILFIHSEIEKKIKFIYCEQFLF